MSIVICSWGQVIRTLQRGWRKWDMGKTILCLSSIMSNSKNKSCASFPFFSPFLDDDLTLIALRNSPWIKNKKSSLAWKKTEESMSVTAEDQWLLKNGQSKRCNKARVSTSQNADMTCSPRKLAPPQSKSRQYIFIFWRWKTLYLTTWNWGDLSSNF